MVGYIYLITDTTNGKKYVGQHHYDKEELDPNYHGSGHIIKQIYNKRPHTLKEEYLKTCYSQVELDEWEKYFIFLYNTLYPNGYNLEYGGKGGKHSDVSKRKISEAKKGKPSHNKGVPMSDEQKRKLSVSIKKVMTDDIREKISNSKKGHEVSNETRKKLSESHKGKPSPNKGKQMSEEQKKKLSEARKGKYNTKLSKKVLQFTKTGELVREWPSTAECGRNGFNRGHIVSCCRGERQSNQGFIWKYKKEVV